jgi:hypothetical protein
MNESRQIENLVESFPDEGPEDSSLVSNEETD